MVMIFFGSSMVEQSAVNRWVVGSSPIQRVESFLSSAIDISSLKGK